MAEENAGARIFEDGEEVPLGPRLGMVLVEYDNSDFIHFVKADPETDIIEDSYMMPIKRWENMGKPEKIEVRLEVG